MTYDRIVSLAYYIWPCEWGWRREGRWRHLIEKDRKVLSMLVAMGMRRCSILDDRQWDIYIWL